MGHRLKTMYLETIAPSLMEKFFYANIHQVPKVEKIVVKCGIGDAAQNAKGLQVAMNDLAFITGQKPTGTGQAPIKTRARIAIANYKSKDGQRLGVSVTLRGHMMYSFLDRLISLGLPRTIELEGVTPSRFDALGNYRIRIHEQSMFPETRYDALGVIKGVNVCISTTAKTVQEGQNLLALMGMPFGESAHAMEEEVEEA